jgi:hypothetical protein
MMYGRVSGRAFSVTEFVYQRVGNQSGDQDVLDVMNNNINEIIRTAERANGRHKAVRYIVIILRGSVIEPGF